LCIRDLKGISHDPVFWVIFEDLAMNLLSNQPNF